MIEALHEIGSQHYFTLTGNPFVHGGMKSYLTFLKK